MTTKKTKSTTELRRCTGSARFGIEPHEAPRSDFPKHPSRKDGLGTMCTEHWRAYVKGLREARGNGKGTTVKSTTTSAGMKATTKQARRSTPMAHIPSAKDVEVAKAEALIAEIDALPGPEMVARVGEDDVQVALETIANGRTAETPPAEAIDGGSGEADAA